LSSQEVLRQPEVAAEVVVVAVALVVVAQQHPRGMHLRQVLPLQHPLQQAARPLRAVSGSNRKSGDGAFRPLFHFRLTAFLTSFISSAGEEH
jgi:hypothetical protein